MTSQVLKKDAIIRDVLGTLLHPDEYVRIVPGHLSACRKAHGNARVQIGITGKGMIPSHKIQYIEESGKEQLFGAFDQDRRFTDVDIQKSTWSQTAMTFDEVQALLGEMRGFKKT